MKSARVILSLLLTVVWMASIVSAETVALAQGECRSYSRRYRSVFCRIPNTTPEMTLEVVVIRNTGWRRCEQGVNFAVAADNSYIRVDYPCSAVFRVSSVTDVTIPSIITTTTTTTTTTTPETSVLPYWSPWSEFGPCTRSCDGGLQSRSRQCSTGNDRDCSNIFSYSVETARCNTQDCPVSTVAPSVSPNSGSCGISNPFRIIGGTVAGVCQFPWMVMVYDSVGGSVCGGSILDENTIITAAHCLFRENSLGQEQQVSASDIVVYSGSSQMPFSNPDILDLRRNQASRITVHGGYNSNTLTNDIALIKLSQPITFDSCHRPVCLSDGSKTPQQTNSCRTMGWGVDSNRARATVKENLYWASVPVASSLDCGNVYGRLSTENTFCAGGDGKDACQGDSGGPLVCPETGSDGVARYTMYGIVSAGIDSECGTLYGLYTRVSSYLTWIQSNRN